MNKYIKYAVVGLAGYLIGFYEMKYKVVKALLSLQNKDEVENSEAKDESQK